MGEYVFSIGTSYEEKVYFGATIGLPSINYYENSIYSESNFSNDTNYSLNNFTYDQQFSAVGNGINLKLGTILELETILKLQVQYTLRLTFPLKKTIVHRLQQTGIVVIDTLKILQLDILIIK